MSPFATKVWFTEDMMYVMLTDGREIGVPILWFPKLRKATGSQLKNFRLIGNGIGIHWEDLDEDISVAGLLTGRS
ncbi:MAG: DUF2442 domain-containing protein [Bacteroidales bacterium]|nr:DUF2442 domain-containing protein [Bacteroidales bacterium]